MEQEGVDTISYELGARAELDETGDLVRQLGRRAFTAVADTRDLDQVEAVVAEATEQFGGIDIVCANAGIASWATSWEMTALRWKEMVDINLTGVFNTVRAALPGMISRGRGGSIVLTSSTAGINGYQNTAHYTAAKYGVIGLTKVMAQEVGQYSIRVNAVCPTTVNTPLVINDGTFRLFAPNVENPGATSSVSDGRVGGGGPGIHLYISMN
ncbi:hypothetical protein NCCP2495_17730 [Dietzia sp. NCCP-2495]|uniref:SDR family NAD(P)-dependent oxidoreductase n=1 Tax=Dietzia sp. NCCP-2495 TaxID=2934675 RepID=UPI00222E7D2E|nr:SDR family NAD(P)-dependent oxidoreductase [Dietzia sp. NCCP-2495]GLB63894.1 hypothetical protein NCCP2495_17730 [Dietzia sp. NCCP-2495]